MGCSPCGEVAECELCQRLAWPGGAAVALAGSALDYTVALGFFELEPSGLQLPIPLQCSGVGLGVFNGLGFLLLNAVNEHAVDQVTQLRFRFGQRICRQGGARHQSQCQRLFFGSCQTRKQLLPRKRSVIVELTLQPDKNTDYWKDHEVTKEDEYAVLTNIIHQEWSGVSVKNHKDIKGLKTQNLRDHMNEAELIFTALAELSTRQIAESVNATGMPENAEAGKKGGKIAKTARLELESKAGRSVITSENYLPPVQKKGQIK